MSDFSKGWVIIKVEDGQTLFLDGDGHYTDSIHDAYVYGDRAEAIEQLEPGDQVARVELTLVPDTIHVNVEAPLERIDLEITI